MAHTMRLADAAKDREPSARYYAVTNARGKHVGTIHNIRASDGRKAWRMIASGAAMADLVPIPSPPHDSPEAALAYINTLGA